MITTDDLTSPNFAVIATEGKTVQLAFIDSSSNPVYSHFLTTHVFVPNPFKLTAFYYTNIKEGSSNSLIVQGQIQNAITSFAGSTMQWSFSTRFNAFTDGLTVTTNADKSQVACGYTNLVTKSTNLPPFCTLIQGKTSSFVPSVLSIENYATIPASTNVEFDFYDIKNPVSDFNLPVVSLQIYDAAAGKFYYYRIWNPFTAVSSAINPTTTVMNYPTPSSLTYGASINKLTFPAIAWPSGMDCTGTTRSSCRFRIEYSNVFYKPYSTTVINIGSTAQTIIGNKDLITNEICNLLSPYIT